MAVNMSIKNVPETVAAKLRERAERNHRSLQGELMAILENATHESDVDSSKLPARTDDLLSRLTAIAGDRGLDTMNRLTRDEAHRREGERKLSIEEVAEESRKLFPRGTPSSTGFIREMRDGRYGEAWAKTGRHAEPD